MRVIDSGGKEIDPATVDWQDFRYSIRQAPGPHNALGLVKFIFPNPHFVFLHDTPHREYFDRDVRTFSSGCIRIENPMEFARLLLEDQEGWSAEKIRATVDAEKTKTVFLSEPLPVLVLYWTLTVEEEGQSRFLQDVYDRDQAILDALNAPFAFSAPSGLPSWAKD
jgi:murein L,D-transpeptidase YcbB/YkuD